MAKKSYLDSIEVPKPCNAAWNKMIGDDEKRFCLSCEKDVYNLSAMPRRKARKLVAGNAGKICVRYARLPNGKLLTTDQKLHQISRRTSTIAASVIATTLSFSAVSYAQGEAKPRKTKSKQKEVVEQTNNKRTKDEIGINQISFTVSDINGQIIPNAKVKLTNEKSKQEFIVITNKQGIAYFNSLPNGKYKAEISAEYFVKQEIFLQINQPIEPNMKISLEVSAISVFVGIYAEEKSYEVPFFQAIVQEDIKSLKKSIATGFDVNTKNENKITALHVAVESENLDIVKLLIQNGAMVNAQDNKGRTPLMMIENTEKPIKILEFLIKNGADVNTQDKEGKTPLMYAVYDEIENFEAVKLFIKSGAKLETRDKRENTALIIASDGYSEEIVEYLLKAGANPNVKDKEGDTPLSLAEENKEMIEILRRYGAIDIK